VTYVLGADWIDPTSRVTDELANALAEVIPTLGDDMLAAYSRFAKTPTRELCDAFLISLRRALRAALVRPCTNTERQKALIFAEVASARAIEVAQEPGFACERFLQDPDESRGGYRLGLLPHVQAFANLLARLNRFSRRAGRVRLMHDEQKQFDHVLRDCFARMTSNAFSAALESSVANERAGVDWNFTPGKFDLSFVDSKDHAGVQAADIIAGFCVRRLNEVINGGHPDSRFDEATLMLSSVESKAGLNFVTTNERRLAFWAERREEAAQSTASGEQGKGSMPRWRHWMPLEHECGCVVDWGCDANQSEELAASFMPAAAPFPCPWHGSASGQSATAPAEGEERFLVASGVFYRRATNDLREDGRRNRHIALAISRASSGSR
jgi:hypothetical protein